VRPRHVTPPLSFICCAAFLALPQNAVAADCAVFDAIDRQNASGTALTGAACSTYATANATAGFSCYWTHPYRDAAAQARASGLWQMLQHCRAGQPLVRGGGVNHPDSYDLREWAHGRDVYAVSVKDKAALDRTLVFVRVEPGRPGPAE